MTEPARMVWWVRLSGFRISPDLAGRRLSLGVHGGYRMSVDFPKDVDDSLVTGGEWRPDAPAQVTTAVAGVATVITVQEMAVRARFETNLDYLATLPSSHQPTTEQWQEVETLRRDATGVAERTLRWFVEWVALKRGTYGVVVEQPPTATFNCLEVGRPPNRIRFGTPGPRTTIIVGETGLNAREARTIQRRLVRWQTVGLAWQQFLEAHRRLHAEDDPRPAVVEAVTAVEVGLKDALRRKGRGSKAVELLAKTDRLRELMKEVADAVLGESYAAAAKREYDLLVGLIEQRQSLVHRGEPPDASLLESQLGAVAPLLKWLDAKAPGGP